MTDDTTAETAIVAKPTAPLPIFSGAQMSEALTAYKDLQRVLDKQMPDQIMMIGSGKNAKPFRKKGYWRACQVAFALDLALVNEERIDLPDDWGYLVTFRATAPNGRSMDGDGSCMASEKIVHAKDWQAWYANNKKGKPRTVLDADGNPRVDKQATAENATVHNVRAHAHTRAKNRAISDLVGFGEVSAEEVNRDGRQDEGGGQGDRQSRQQTAGRRADTESRPAPRTNGDSALTTRYKAMVANHADLGAARIGVLGGLCIAWNGDKNDVVSLDALAVLIDGAEAGMDNVALDQALRMSNAGDVEEIGRMVSDWKASPGPDDGATAGGS